MKEVVIIDNVRTGLAKSFRGSFNLTRSDDMVAYVIDALLERNPKVSPGEIEDVIVGMADHTGEQTGNMARLSVMLSKLPVTTAASTINRFCSSGVQAIAFAANQIAAMPSLHFGWALIEAIAVISVLKSRWRWLIVIHPSPLRSSRTRAQNPKPSPGPRHRLRARPRSKC